MNIAATVRKQKELHPELYCRVPSCLWRVQSRLGATPCQKHPIPQPTPSERPVAAPSPTN